MSQQLFHKDHVNHARIMRQPDALLAPEDPPERSEPVLQLYESPTPEQLALPAPYSELIRVADRIMKANREILSQVLAEERKDAERQFADVDAKLAEFQRENETLRASIGGFEKQLAQLAGENKALLVLAKREAPSAPRIIDWDIDAANAIAVPKMSDGTKAAPLGLLGLFTSLAQRFAEVDRPSKRARAPREAKGD